MYIHVFPPVPGRPYLAQLDRHALIEHFPSIQHMTDQFGSSKAILQLTRRWALSHHILVDGARQAAAAFDHVFDHAFRRTAMT